MKKIMFAALVLFFGVVGKSFSQTVYASDKGGKYHTADCKLSGDANARDRCKRMTASNGGKCYQHQSK